MRLQKSHRHVQKNQRSLSLAVFHCALLELGSGLKRDEDDLRKSDAATLTGKSANDSLWSEALQEGMQFSAKYEKARSVYMQSRPAPLACIQQRQRTCSNKVLQADRTRR